MNRLLKVLLFGITLFLVGCQSVLDAPSEAIAPTTQIPHSDTKWQNHLEKLKQIKTYSVKGQFGYLSEQERFSSHFDWQYHSATDFSLILSSNLSTKSLALHRTTAGITVSDNEGRHHTEADVNALMEEVIGVSFPIDQFAYWIKGQPELHLDYVVNEKRQLTTFSYPLKNSVWKVNFVEYHENRQPNLPKLIVLTTGSQSLKIRLDHWVY